MRILWMTIDRGQRVARIFEPLCTEMQKIADVSVVSHGEWSHDTIRGTGYGEGGPQLNPSWVNEHDVIFCDAVFAYMSQPWPVWAIPKCVLAEDVHGDLPAIYLTAAHEVYGCEHFFCRYWEATNERWPQLPDLRWLPHSIDPEVFYPSNRERIHSVLLLGRTGADTYPLRHRAVQELQGFPGLFHKPRPEEGQEKPWPVGKEYADLIRQSKIALQGCSIYGYPTLKTLEYPACGALLACDPIPDIARLHFVHGESYIALDDRSIADQLCRLYPDEIQSIAQRGTEVVRNHPTAEIRAHDLLWDLREILKHEQSKHQPLAYSI